MQNDDEVNIKGTIETKICCRCKEELEVDKFGRDKSRKDGLKRACKECRKIGATKYKDKNKEVIKTKDKQYKESIKNDEHFKARRIKESQIRRARKLSLPCTFSLEEWENAKLCFNNRCCYCGEELPLVQEHYLALSKGGNYTKANIIPSCQGCNLSKHDKDVFEWYKSYEFYDKDREQYIIDYLESMKEI